MTSEEKLIAKVTEMTEIVSMLRDEIARLQADVYALKTINQILTGGK